MKRLLKNVLSIVAIGLVLMAAMPAKAQPGATVSMQTFYDELSPYGDWIDDPEYGYVWIPGSRYVGGDFRPYYTGGHWVMTEYGNTWVSDYDWGWAPFHYGRWAYDDYYGWIWIPDTQWGPAWVTWRDGGGYYGWAPMGPRVTISVSIGPRYYVPDNWWVFVPCQYMYTPRFHRYYRGPRYNTTIINRTTVINNTYNNRYIYGPRPGEFQGRTGRRVTVYNINNINRPQRSELRGSSLNIYRPQVSQPSRGAARPQHFERPERAVISGNADNRPRTTQQAPAQIAQPAGRDRNELRANEFNNAQQGRPERADAVRSERQRAEIQQNRSQQQTIENNRQQQWERQRAADAQQQRQREETQRMEEQRIRSRQFEQQRQEQAARQQEQQRARDRQFEQQRQEQAARQIEQQRARQFEQQRQEQSQRQFEQQRSRQFEQPRQEQPQRQMNQPQRSESNNAPRDKGERWNGGGRR